MMTDKTPPKLLRAKDWLDDYTEHLRIRDGDHKWQIAKALAAYAESECSRLASRVSELEGEIGYLRGVCIFPRNEDRLDDFERLASRVEELEGGSGYLLPQAVAMQLLEMLQPLDVIGEPNTLLALTKKAMRLISELDKALKIASCQLAQGSNMDFSDTNIQRWQEDAQRIEQELLVEAKTVLAGAHAEEKE